MEWCGDRLGGCGNVAETKLPSPLPWSKWIEGIKRQHANKEGAAPVRSSSFTKQRKQGHFKQPEKKKTTWDDYQKTGKDQTSSSALTPILFLAQNYSFSCFREMFSDNTKIGTGLLFLGVAFLFTGVLFLFDSALLAIG